MKPAVSILSTFGILVSIFVNQGFPQQSTFDPKSVWKVFYADYAEIQKSIEIQINELNSKIDPKSKETIISKLPVISFEHYDEEVKLKKEIQPRVSETVEISEVDFFIKPLIISDYQVSSKYGNRKHPCRKRKEFHEGIDLSAKTGLNVHASGKGKIKKAVRSSSYGNYIIIQHDNGFETLYAHLSKIEVKCGEEVEQGQVIGKTGSTGTSTGPHLHFEIIKEHQCIDPEKLISF
jgi:murein DD-endopeptidase MepM/ murein hydrolase activator NlpD